MPGSCLGKLILDGRRTRLGHEGEYGSSLPYLSSHPHVQRNRGLRMEAPRPGRVVYQPRLGAKKVVNDHLVSVHAPDWLHTPLSAVAAHASRTGAPTEGSVSWLMAERLRADTFHHGRYRHPMERHVLPGAAGRDASEGRGDWQPKKTEIVLNDGKVLNNQIVSVNSPNWFKEAFENSSSHFEARRQRLKGSYSAALLDAHQVSVGKKMSIQMPDGQTMRSQRAISADAPDFFKEPTRHSLA